MFDSYHICRSCLASDSGLLSLDSLVDGSLNIIDCLKEHLSVNITADDGLPQKICLNCFDSLLFIRKFHLRYLQSEEFLLEQYLESHEGPPDIVAETLASEFTSNEVQEQDILEFVSTIAKDQKFTVSSKGQGGIIVNFDVFNTEEQCSKIAENNDLRDNVEYEARIHNKSQEVNANECYLEEMESLKLGEIVDEKVKMEMADNASIKEVEVVNEIEECTPKQGSQIKKNEAHLKVMRHKYTSRQIFCLQCNKQFNNRNDLRAHFHSVHQEDNARGYCIQCSTVLPSRGALMAHLYEHSLAKSRLTCGYCDRTFSSREKVVAHERTHTGEKPFECQICGRAFNQLSILRTHMSLHTGKTVQCPRCDKKFCRKSILNVHLRTHDDIRPYACHLCDKKYRMKSHLNSHIASHSKERKFSCKICGQAFKAKQFLRPHMNVHTRPFKCPQCPLATSNTYNLRIHLVKMHGIHDDPKIYKQEIPYHEE